MPRFADQITAEFEKESAAAATAVGADDVPRALRELAGGLGAPRTLAELGLKEADLTPAATQAAAESYPNPREVTANGVLGLLTAAFEGWEPRSEVS